MKVERDVIIDLLPAYFSGEASAATRALVEDYFRQYPEFEKTARSAGGPLEGLKVPAASLDSAREKLALERARQVTETKSSFLWLAVSFTLMLLLFRFQNGKLVWIMWDKSPLVGMIFTAMASFFWMLFIYMRRRKDPMPAHTKFLWLAWFYTLILFFFRIQNGKLVWVFFSSEPTLGIVFGAIALSLWISYFFQRRKAKQMVL
ncbi:MAG TPA: hypothetical protein VF532_19615 [Candidatus Angelobacter sp.]